MGSFRVILGKTLREVIDNANKCLVKKEDFVQLVELGDGFCLIYYS